MCIFAAPRKFIRKSMNGGSLMGFPSFFACFSSSSFYLAFAFVSSTFFFSSSASFSLLALKAARSLSRWASRPWLYLFEAHVKFLIESSLSS